MKKLSKSYTFWFIVIAGITVCYNASGNDDKNVVLALSNLPLLSILNRTIFPLGYQEIYAWYWLQILSYAFYGIIIDIIRCLIRKSK